MEHQNENDKTLLVVNEDELFDKVSALIDESRNRVVKAMNTAMVYTYYGIGQYIMEFEQNGQYRAAYGKGVLNRLSSRLTDRYGKGWSYETLAKCRKFYYVYGILSDSQTKSGEKRNLSDTQTNFVPEFSLTWNHYQILMRIDNPDERHFYEIEAIRQNWAYKWLQRQYASSLYERLALSRDKNEVMRLSREGQTLEKPADIPTL